MNKQMEHLDEAMRALAYVHQRLDPVPAFVDPERDSYRERSLEGLIAEAQLRIAKAMELVR